jgi:lipoprotein LprG
VKIVRAAVAGLAGLVLAACSSTTAGTGTATATGSTSASATSNPAQSSSSSSTTATSSTTSSSADTSSEASSGEIDPVAAELISRIVAAYADVTSMTGTLATEAAGTTISATFDQTLADGVASGLDMSLDYSGTTIDLLYVDGRLLIGGAFAQQYGGQWVELTASTTDPTLAQLYTQFTSTVNNSGPSQYLDFLKLATNTQKAGSEQIDGVDTEKYTLELDLTRLDTADISASTKESMQQLAQLGLETVPYTYWVDADGLIRQIEQELAVQGQSVHTLVNFSNYNEPLQITAPDPATVVTK